MDEPKFHLEWRIGTPVLLQRLRGYWKADDIKDYRAALQAAISQRPAPKWFKISHVAASRHSKKRSTAIALRTRGTSSPAGS